jgi:hypothetical protein
MPIDDIHKISINIRPESFFLICDFWLLILRIGDYLGNCNGCICTNCLFLGLKLRGMNKRNLHNALSMKRISSISRKCSTSANHELKAVVTFFNNFYK